VHAGAVFCVPSIFDNRRGAYALLPKHGGAENPTPAAITALVINLFDLYARRNFNAELGLVGLAAFRDSVPQIGRTRAPPSSNTIRSCGSILAEIVAQGTETSLSDRSGKARRRSGQRPPTRKVSSERVRSGSSVDSANSNALRILVRMSQRR